MFFDLVLLSRQHKRRLNLAWVAGTRGVRYVAKKDVLEVDISLLCEEIRQYVCSQSESPRSRFSLRLSSVLINGTMKIYRQKAIFCIDEVVRVLTQITRPRWRPDVEASVLMETPPSPILKKRGKKRPHPVKEEETPESELEKLVAAVTKEAVEGIAPPLFQEDEAVLQARAEDITLRETQVLRQEQDFGTFGVLDEEELIPRRALTRSPVAPPAEVVAPPTEVAVEPVTPAEPPEKPRFKRFESSSSESEPEQEAVRITVQAEVHVDAEPFREPLPQPEAVDVEPLAEPLRRPEAVEPMEVQVVEEIQRPALREMEITEIEERDKEMVKRKKKKEENLLKLRIILKPHRFVRINQWDENEIQEASIRPLLLPKFKQQTPNLTNVLNLYLIRPDIDVQRRAKVSEVPSLEDSATLRRKSGRVTPPAEIPGEVRAPQPVLPEVEEPIPEILVTAETPRVPSPEVSVVARPSAIGDKTIEEVRAVEAEEAVRSPKKRPRLMEEEPRISADVGFITIPTELVSREITEEPVSMVQETVDSVGLPVLTEKSRQQDIVNKVFIHGRVTLEDVCQKPINKLNIARAFNDVLILCKHNYVVLVTEEDSSELKFVEKGPKMSG